MEQSMNDRSRMSYQPSLLNSTDVISLPASGSGTMHSDGRDGLTTDASGRDLVRASLSPRQAKEAGLLISGTYGLRGSTLSRSADLTPPIANCYGAGTAH